MFWEYISGILYIMSFTLVPFIATLGISLKVIKKKEQAKTYKKSQTELEQILGF